MIIDECTAVHNQLIKEISVYPNPATIRVCIKASISIFNVKIYNYIGQMVSETPASSKLVNINTSQLNPGIYLFRIQTSEDIIIKPIVIE